MSHYKHLTINENDREMLSPCLKCEIAQNLKHKTSTIFREIDCYKN